MTWKTRPPQYRFDGDPVRNARKADWLRKLEAAGKLAPAETRAERTARLRRQREEAAANPDAQLWQERAQRKAAFCKGLMGQSYDVFMELHGDELRAYTWQALAEGFERLGERSRYLAPPYDTARAIFDGRL